MPRRKYTPQQAAALALIEEIHQEHVNAKATLRREIEQAFDDRMTDREIKKSLAMNAALAMGVAKTDIGRAIGTSNFETIKNLLARTAGDATLEDLVIDPLSERYTFTPATGDSGPRLTVTLDGAELETALRRAGWDNPVQAAEYGLGKLGTAEFEWFLRADMSHYLRPLTETSTAGMHYNAHPVVRWLDDSTEHTAEATDYLVSHLNR